LQAENAIDSWRHWDAELRTRPVILGQLSGGRSNRSFLLDADGMRMVLRLNGEDSMLPGSDRSNEITIWRAASAEDIAPPLLHVDGQHRFLVSSYIDNKLPTKPLSNSKFIDQAFGLLNQCHQLDVGAPSIDYISHIEQYWQIAERKNQAVNPALQQHRESMQRLLKELIDSNPQTGLCHHDPVVANFVGTPNKLYLIDWEYAAHGLTVMDYAALGIEWELNDTTILAQTNIEPDSLNMAKTLYQYLCTLWEEVTI